jgi:2-polyprenyl-3-methyl-5-hydroxy-6-metoxy-1,4-benzoquinol methylase
VPSEQARRADRPTAVARLLGHPASVAVLDALPVPLGLAGRWLRRDNAREVARDDWARLADPAEQPRYAAVRDAVARHAPHDVPSLAADLPPGARPFVLDVGCSRGLLLDGLAYGRYLGVDASATAVERAEQRWRGDGRVRFAVADASGFEPAAPPDAVVLNEVVYYLPQPRETALRYASTLAPGGVLVLSVFARAWASRRLVRRLAETLALVECRQVSSGHLAWSVAVYRVPLHEAAGTNPAGLSSGTL